MTATYDKPVPVPDEATQPWFDALLEHKLLLQYFPSADHYQFPYADRCWKDWSTEWEWREAKGTGTLYTWGRMHQVYEPCWADAVPYFIATVELDEGPRMQTALVNAEPEQLKAGMAVRLVFDDVEARNPETGEVQRYAIPKFEPA